MKVLVLWEKPTEMRAANNLADVLNKIGTTLLNAQVVAGGVQIRPTFQDIPVEALAMTFETLADPTRLPKPRRPAPPKGVRDLIFPDED